MRRCPTCYYYDRGCRTCDFMLVTGVRRGCPIDDCFRYLPREGLHHRPRFALQGSPAGTRNNPKYKAMEAFYKQGMSDRQIAEKVGCSKSLVQRWRTKAGLPSHFPAGRRPKEVAT